MIAMKYYVGAILILVVAVMVIINVRVRADIMQDAQAQKAGDDFFKYQPQKDKGNKGHSLK